MRKADNLSPSCAVVMKPGYLNFLESSGPAQVCNGTDLPFTSQKFVPALMTGCMASHNLRLGARWKEPPRYSDCKPRI